MTMYDYSNIHDEVTRVPLVTGRNGDIKISLLFFKGYPLPISSEEYGIGCSGLKK